MPTIQEQIKAVEDEISTTEYNKSSMHHIGKLKGKLARLKDDMERRKSIGKASGGGYAVPKDGDATIVIVGPPNVGKSTLLNQLTDAKSQVGDYEFTTLTTVPGIMGHKGARIQFLDLPGLVAGAAKGRGRGKDVLGVIRTADMSMLMCDVRSNDLSIIVKEMQDFGIRLNAKPPDVVIKPKNRGGVKVTTTCKLTKLDPLMVKVMVESFGHLSADVTVRSDITDTQLVDALTGNRIYMPAVIVLNKVDLVDKARVREIHRTLPTGMKIVDISLKEGTGLDLLKDAIYESLRFIRVYLKPKGGKPDMDRPLILRRGSTVRAVCDRLHRDFVKKFRYANVWGKSAKFEGQTIGLDHTLSDKDVITLIISK